MPVVADYTALLSGDSWNGIEVAGKPVIVTYSFPTTAAGYLADVDGFTAGTVASFQAFNSAEQAQARAALGEWAAASGLIFVEVAPGQGDINFQLVDFDTTSGPSYAGKGGIGFYPFGDWNYFTYPSFASDIDGSGDVFMNSRFAAGGSVTYGTLLHEIGHAIGLKHPTEIVTNLAANPAVTHDQVLASDDPALTIMAEVGGPGISDHLKTLDQQAAAFLYGPAGTGQVVTSDASGANASVSSWSWNAASQTLTQAGFAGNDTVRGSSVTDVVSGLDGNDRLFGLNGNDTLDGGAGNDLLNGGPGDDTLTGGTGDDTYMVDGAGDDVVELEGEGFDRVLAGVSVTLAANVELLQIFGAGLTGTGNGLANTMFGDGSLGSTLHGLGGDDYMVGGSGADTLDGGTGVDTMFGGAGNDTYYVDGAGDSVREDSTAGIDDGGVDLVNSSVSLVLGAFVENLTLTGGSSLNGTGNELNNTLTGNGAANALDGKGGADRMYGGKGDDTYVVDDAGDKAYELNGEGADTVLSSVSYNLTGQYIESLTLTGTSAINGTGNTKRNTLIGNDAANLLDGGGDSDVLRGGKGDDTYVVDNAGDKAYELNGEGSDAVLSSVSYNLTGQYIESLTLTGASAINATGNSKRNTLVGNDAANLLDGGGDSDVLRGGKGDDTYVVDNAGDKAYEAKDQGSDTVLSSVSYNLTGQYIEKLTLTGSGNVDATGNTLANTITGNAGNNLIGGGTGNDLLAGGGGNDTFLFDTALSANVDTVADFDASNDTIRLDQSIFAAITTLGTLSAAAFFAGAAAHDADDRIIYNSATGDLFYDRDGTGAAAAVQFAHLDGTPAVSNTNFTVVA